MKNGWFAENIKRWFIPCPTGLHVLALAGNVRIFGEIIWGSLRFSRQ
jgi:hypothetical protein